MKERELVEPRKEAYDSTGLRANHSLNTPRMRCESFAKAALTYAGSADDRQKMAKRGAAWLPVLHVCNEFACLAHYRCERSRLLRLAMLF